MEEKFLKVAYEMVKEIKDFAKANGDEEYEWYTIQLQRRIEKLDEHCKIWNIPIKLNLDELVDEFWSGYYEEESSSYYEEEESSSYDEEDDELSSWD